MIYYVGDSLKKTRDGLPILSLYRWRNGETVEIVRGVLSMQINFSTYDNAANALGFYAPSDPVLNLNNVGFVRVGLLVTHVSGLLLQHWDENSYQVLDEKFISGTEQK